MFSLDDYNVTDSALPEIMYNRQPRTFNGPLLGLLLAASLLAKASHAKPYLLGHNHNPWMPSWYNFFPQLPPYWQPNNYAPTTNPPQISQPPINQQQIIHIHELPPASTNPGESYQDLKDPNIVTSDEVHEHESVENGFSTLPTNFAKESQENYPIEDIEVDASNDNYTKLTNVTQDLIGNCTDEINFNSTGFGNETGADILYVNDDKETSGTNLFVQRRKFDDEKRRRTTPKAARRRGVKRPSYDDYIDKISRNRNRKRPYRRRTTTPAYDDYEDNRRTRRPGNNRNKGNRRPINRDEYYDNYDYDYNYSNEDGIFARQGTSTPSTAETDTESTKTSGMTTVTTTEETTAANNSSGYTYGPSQGYGPSNGNEHVSFTYGPPSGPKQDGVAPLLDWYNPYSKNSILRRLQELLSPNNFYNNQYDYNDNF